MDLSNGSEPNIVDSIQYTPDFNTSMQHSVTLANMMDQRRADLAARQRAGNIRDIFSQNPGAITDQSQVSPDILRQVYAQDPATADAMQTANYKNMMGQGAYMRGGASQENAATKKQTFTVNEIQKLANAHTNQLANTFKPIIDNPDDPDAKSKYTVAYNMMANGVGVPKDPTDPLEVSKITMSPEQFANLPTPDQFDPKTTPMILKSYQDYVLGLQNTYNNELKKQQVTNETNKTGAVVGELGAKAGLENANAGAVPAKTDQEQQKIDETNRHNMAMEAAARKRIALGMEQSSQINVSDDELEGLKNGYLEGKFDPALVMQSLSGNRNAESRVKLLMKIKDSGDPAAYMSLDSQAAKQFKSAPYMQQVRAIDTFIPNITKMESEIKARPEMGLKILNQGLAEYGKQSGIPNLTNIETLNNVLATELNTSMTGSLTQSDLRLKEAVNSLNSKSPATGALASLKLLRLLELNRRAVLSSSAGRYGEMNFVDKYGPMAQVILDGVKAESTGSAKQYVDTYKEKYGDQLYNFTPGSGPTGKARNAGGNQVQPETQPQPGQSGQGIDWSKYYKK